MAFVDGAPRITTMKLTVRGVVPGIDQAAFARAAEEAKIGCPVSNLMKGNIALELDARLE
jgi:osmotically inducible protein OsmC